MKSNFFSLLALFFAIGLPSKSYGMEKKPNNPEKKVYSYEEMQQRVGAESIFPKLFGYNKEQFSNKEYLESYLTELKKFISLFPLQAKFSETIEAVLNAKRDERDALTNTFFINSFEYTDKPCAVTLASDGCLVTFNDKQLGSIELPNKYMLTSSEGKAAYLQAKKLLKTNELNANERTTNIAKIDIHKTLEEHKKWAPFITSLLESANPDLIVLGNWMKYIIAHEQCSKLTVDAVLLLKNFAAKLNPDLIPIYMKMNCIQKAKHLTSDFYITNINRYWDNSALIKKCLPNFYSLIEALQTIIYLGCNDAQQTPDAEQSNFCYELLLPTFLAFQNMKPYYERLYTPLHDELTSYYKDKKRSFRNELMKKYSQQFFLDEQFPKKLFKQEQPLLDNTPDLFEKLSLAESKKKNPPTQQKKKSKNSRKKTYNQRQTSTYLNQSNNMSQEEPEEPERYTSDVINISNTNSNPAPLEKIIYHPRILEWSNKDYSDATTNSEIESLLYHKYKFVVDEYNWRYGIKQERQNKTYPNQMDIVSYLGGEICYPDGRKKTVLFVCCKNQQGICYHRGYQKKDETLFKEFETSEFEYNFPKLSVASQEKKSPKEKNNLMNDPIENQFCVYIEDKINNDAKIKLVLFKPAYRAGQE